MNPILYIIQFMIVTLRSLSTHLKLYHLLLISPLVGVVSTLTGRAFSPEQMGSSMMNSTTVIPGFPIESIGSGLILGLFVILLLRMTTKFGWGLIKQR